MKLIRPNLYRRKECQVCGINKNLTVHHIVPKRYGGMDITHNLLTVCKACHSSIEQYISIIETTIKTRILDIIRTKKPTFYNTIKKEIEAL